jgi:hypothetical protein
MKPIFPVCVLVSSMLVSGCASTQYKKAATQIQTANPHAALEYVALAIQQKPDDKEMRSMLDDLIKTISRDHERRIELMRREKAYEEAVAECDRVIASAQLVSSLPGGNTVLYHEERERAELASLAAEKNYDLAAEYESQQQSREAVDAYCRALGFRANYKDAEKRRMDLVESSTTKLFIKSESPEDADSLKHLMSALGPAALASRPRFLKLVRDETNATSICTVSIEPATVDDTGWVGKSLRRDTEAYQVTDKKTGETKNYPARHVDGTLYTRTITCTASASFSVTPIRATDPQPAGNASAQAQDQKQYAAHLSGDAGLLPPGVVNLPRQQPALRDPSALKTECVRALAQKLGEQLFMSYK